MQTKFGYAQAKSQSTPMVTNQVLNKQKKQRENELTNEKVVNQREYREVVGSLMYLVSGTKPDLPYAVNVLSRHKHNPTENGWKMVIRIFKYIAYSASWQLTYKGLNEEMEVFSDASFADCKNYSLPAAT
ncbi:secreted RxLR effector protein 161-like [Nasonia vitripennis]|uniref:Uncharacterized protein n=1 Tax=Nasonia vitripennis TaxID=7425 RepID=A0A7M7Q3X3_NASVI|nr:secreted RxLR effector protein 161-like [Nasonia vitripennis]